MLVSGTLLPQYLKENGSINELKEMAFVFCNYINPSPCDLESCKS
jgi:hypothetical protein